ncbi:hypothetical protein KAW18_18785 [candidate division WOR-3 bacterium]|nr:hypothetical protein [candidate division WOR-3 bacterium]
MKANKKSYREDHRDEANAAAKKWYEENTEQAKAQHKKWAKANLEKLTAEGKKYREGHREEINAATRKWAKANVEKVKAKNKSYREDNPDKIRELQRERRTYLSAYGDCERLNQWFVGSEGHHVDPDTIIHIPAQMHRSVWHSLKTGQGMEEINIHAFNWLNRVHAESLQTTLDAFG